jgi:hypothetical protein
VDKPGGEGRNGVRSFAKKIYLEPGHLSSLSRGPDGARTGKRGRLHGPAESSVQNSALGATVLPLPPLIFNGCTISANSLRPRPASTSSFMFSSRCTPWIASAI